MKSAFERDPRASWLAWRAALAAALLFFFYMRARFLLPPIALLGALAAAARFREIRLRWEVYPALRWASRKFDGALASPIDLVLGSPFFQLPRLGKEAGLASGRGLLVTVGVSQCHRLSSRPETSGEEPIRPPSPWLDGAPVWKTWACLRFTEPNRHPRYTDEYLLPRGVRPFGPPESYESYLSRGHLFTRDDLQASPPARKVLLRIDAFWPTGGDAALATSEGPEIRSWTSEQGLYLEKCGVTFNPPVLSALVESVLELARELDRDEGFGKSAFVEPSGDTDPELVARLEREERERQERAARVAKAAGSGSAKPAAKPEVEIEIEEEPETRKDIDLKRVPPRKPGSGG